MGHVCGGQQARGYSASPARNAQSAGGWGGRFRRDVPSPARHCSNNSGPGSTANSPQVSFWVNEMQTWEPEPALCSSCGVVLSLGYLRWGSRGPFASVPHTGAKLWPFFCSWLSSQNSPRIAAVRATGHSVAPRVALLSTAFSRMRISSCSSFPRL